MTTIYIVERVNTDGNMPQITEIARPTTEYGVEVSRAKTLETIRLEPGSSDYVRVRPAQA